MARDKTVGSGRMYFMGNARAAIVAMVILLHTALAYAKSSKAWWVVVDDRSWAFADVLCGVFDLVLMPALFFISGFFASGSFGKYGSAGLMRRKARALALPWFLGVVFLNPFVAFMTGAVRGASGSGYWRIAAEYLVGFFRFPANPIQDRSASPYYFSHYHLWFLSLLFIFFAFYCIYRAIDDRLRPVRPATVPDSPHRIAFRASSAVFASTIGYAVTYSLFGDSWFVISIVQFQVSRLVPYACAFACGVEASRRSWFREGNAARPVRLLICAAVLVLPYLLVTSLMGKDRPFAIILGYALFRYSLCGLLVAGMIVAARRYFDRETAFSATLSSNSFIAYILHLDVVIAFLALCTRLGLGPPWIQLPVVFALSLASSFGLAIILEKTIRIL